MENNVENEELNQVDQPAPVIEKITHAELEEAKEEIVLEQPTIFDGMIDAMLQLSDEQAEMIMKELDKKLEMLRKED